MDVSETIPAAPPSVAVVHCADYGAESVLSAVQRNFTLLGGLEQWVKPGDTVLLKPNFIAPQPVSRPAQTHPQVILATAQLLKDLGAHPVVADSPAWGTVQSCAKALGLIEPLKHLGVPLRPLNRARACRIHGTTVGLSAVALEADAIINLPKLKAHQQMVATLAVKNMFGCVTGKQKPYWHFSRGQSRDRFAAFLLDIYRFLPPAVSLVDGIVALEDKGPIHGQARSLGWLIGSTDAIACETICAQLIGLAIADLPILRSAQQLGYGCCDSAAIKLVGDSDDFAPCPDFVIPELIPIRFSLPRVIKSIAQGAYGALKNRRRKRA